MRVLLVHNKISFLEEAKQCLEGLNDSLDVHILSSPEEALDLLDEEEFDAMVSGYELSDMNGLELLEIIREGRKKDIPFIFFTDKGDEEVVKKALNLGADHYLGRGEDLKSRCEVLVDELDRVVERWRARKSAESRLRKSERKYRTIFENSGTNVIIQNGKFKEVNPEFVSLTGYVADDLIGRDSLSIVPYEERKEVRKKAIEMLKKERTEPYEHRIERKDGEMRWLLEKVTSIKYENERATLASFIDITEHRRTEEKRRLLLAFLRHDLRNKVQIARGYLKLLRDFDLSEEAKEYLSKAGMAIDEAVELIEEMRGRESKSGAGMYEITKEGAEILSGLLEKDELKGLMDQEK